MNRSESYGSKIVMSGPSHANRKAEKHGDIGGSIILILDFKRLLSHFSWAAVYYLSEVFKELLGIFLVLIVRQLIDTDVSFSLDMSCHFGLGGGGGGGTLCKASTHYAWSMMAVAIISFFFFLFWGEACPPLQTNDWTCAY